MLYLPVFLATMLATPLLAEGFDRPVPQAQSATAEFWFGLASLTLILSLVLVQKLVTRR